MMRGTRETRSRNESFLRVSAIVAFLLLLVVFVMGGTRARYTEKVQGSDSARVARFDVSVGDGSKVLDLFSTIKNTGGEEDEKNVVKGDGENIIAPGTEGEFAVVLNNDSEVSVAYKIDFDVENEDEIPIVFSTDNGDSWKSILEGKTGEFLVGSDNDSESLKILWKWDFEGNDEIDTELGKAGEAEVKVSMEVVFEQID